MKIILDPHPLLHRRLDTVKNVEEKTRNLSELAETMKTIMVQAQGVGLAANQVGENLQLFVILSSLAQENNVPEVFINPEITEYSKGQDTAEEGCLSLPGYFALIDRSKKIKIKALDLDGQKIRFKARGFLARVLQHETDHLNGLLIKDLAHS